MVETRSSARKAARAPSGDSVATDMGASPPRARKNGADSGYSTARVAAAWAVHLYTGLGLPVNCYGVHVAMYEKRSFGLWLLCNWLAIFIDATDGTFARRAEVKKVIPGYDGAGLDNIIDYITFAFSPALAICVFQIVDGVPLQMVCAFMVLIAAGYQFCQSTAKTEEAFIGFPSYWNILIHYLYYLNAPSAVVVGSIAFCAVMSFVPFHFVYPSRTKYMQKTTLIGSAFWGVMMLAPVVSPKFVYSNLLLKLSLFYPVYYCALSYVINSKKAR